MLTLKQAFSTAAALQSAKTQIKLCEACPMHSLHKLCERIEGTTEHGFGSRGVCFGILTLKSPLSVTSSLSLCEQESPPPHPRAFLKPGQTQLCHQSLLQPCLSPFSSEGKLMPGACISHSSYAWLYMCTVGTEQTFAD